MPEIVTACLVFPLIVDYFSHLSVGEVCVGVEPTHRPVLVLNEIKEVPLYFVILSISVAVQSDAEILRNIPQLVGLVPAMNYM